MPSCSRLLTTITCSFALAPAAFAAVTSSAPDAFTVEHVVVVALPPGAAYARLLTPAAWWDGAHTYSGDAKNLTLAAAPGGCFCERLPDGGFVEHLRVIYVQPGKVLRLDGGLGPLQAMGARGVMTYSLKPEGAGTKVTMTYRVLGASGSFEKLAEGVDGMLGATLRRYAEVGASAKSAAPAAASAAAQARSPPPAPRASATR